MYSLFIPSIRTRANHVIRSDLVVKPNSTCPQHKIGKHVEYTVLNKHRGQAKSKSLGTVDRQLPATIKYVLRV